MRILLLLAMLVSSPAYACPPGMPCGALDEGDMHKEADRDNDGFVTTKEFALYYSMNDDMAEVFTCSDVNRDGKLDEAEFRRTTQCSQSIHNNQEIDDILQKNVEETNKNTTTKMKIVPIEKWNEQFENKEESNN
jgi:hypothetical protein